MIDVLARSRLIVTVGTGGVGKTTIAAALGIAAARRGRRALVLTIDPARALAAALGLDGLAADGEPVPAAALAGAGLALPVPLDAAMLDQRAAWDAFVRRHAPTPAHAAALLGNRVYQALSTSFAGSTEYMALEEMSRHVDSGRYDLVIVDTPPAAHALDFVSAPDRIAPLVERGVVAALARPAGAAGTLARFVARRIEGATGARTLAELATFFAALEALVDAAAARARHARAMLRAPGTAFVLVAAARAALLAETGALATQLAAAAAPLAAVVVNRVQPPVDAAVDIAPALAALTDAPTRAWMSATWADAVAAAAAERAALARLASVVPGLPVAAVTELPRDPQPLRALGAIADQLSATPSVTAISA